MKSMTDNVHFVVAAAALGTGNTGGPEPHGHADARLTGLLVSWCVRQLPIVVDRWWRELFDEAVQVTNRLISGQTVHYGLVADVRETLGRMAALPDGPTATAACAVGLALDAYTGRENLRVTRIEQCVYWAARAVPDPDAFVAGLEDFRHRRHAA